MASRSAFVLVTLALATPLAAAPLPDRGEYQRKADEASWSWPKNKPNIGDGFAKGIPYGLTMQKIPDGPLSVSFWTEERVLYVWDCNGSDQFVVKDHVLYHTQLNPRAVGCAIFTVRVTHSRSRTERPQVWLSTW